MVTCVQHSVVCWLLLQAEAEEAEKQARIALEMKKSLTHILLHVTDTLFGMPQSNLPLRPLYGPLHLVVSHFP